MTVKTKRKRESLRKELRALIAPSFLMGLRSLTNRMRLEQVQRLGARLGRHGWIFARHRLRIALRNLQLVYSPELTHALRQKLAIKAFESVGMMGLEMVKLPTLPPEELVDIAPIEGLEHLQASIAAGSGTILIGAHLGNWEIGPVRLNQEGFDVVPLARPSSMLRIARTVDALREGMAVPTIPVHGGIRPCLRLLRKNTVIGILPDRYARGQGLDVEYMGHTTNLWHTPMLLALRSGAQMLPCNTVRQDDGSFRVYIDEPIPVTPTTPIDIGTQQVFHCLEKRVRQHPEQYLWQYDLWPDVEL